MQEDAYNGFFWKWRQGPSDTILLLSKKQEYHPSKKANLTEDGHTDHTIRYGNMRLHKILPTFRIVVLVLNVDIFVSVVVVWILKSVVLEIALSRVSKGTRIFGLRLWIEMYHNTLFSGCRLFMQQVLHKQRTSEEKAKTERERERKAFNSKRETNNCTRHFRDECVPCWHIYIKWRLKYGGNDV